MSCGLRLSARQRTLAVDSLVSAYSANRRFCYWGIAVLPPADGCGKPSRPLIVAAAPTPTSGRLIKRSCPNVPIILWERKPVRRLTRNVGILRFRQRVSRFVRKTLSFSKSERNHELGTRWFIVQYNLSTSPIWVESECLKRYKRELETKSQTVYRQTK
jgi:hypothetical protein